MMQLTGIKSKALLRMEELRTKYRCEEIHMHYTEEGQPKLLKFNVDVEKQVARVAEDFWWDAALNCGSLSRYRLFKRGLGEVQEVYDNGRGSTLLALARAGALPTRHHRRHFSQGIMTHCMSCGMKPETIEHVIMECNEDYFEDEDINIRLGLTTDLDGALLRNTKRILVEWESNTREIS